VSTPARPAEVLQGRPYLVLLALAALIGAPVSVVAYFFLELEHAAQDWIFTTLPHELGWSAEPLWWPVPPLLLAGLLTGLVIRYLPGQGGHSPADGFAPHGATSPITLPGIIAAALATLCLGVVLGPEAPLIAIGGGLAVCVLRLSRRPVPPRSETLVAAAGSFAAIATLLGSPIVGAFLLMEAVGLGGTALELVLLPGLLAAGVGSLIFVGLDAWTGLGTFSLRVPGLPHVGAPGLGEFAWAIAIGLAAAAMGLAIQWLARAIRPFVQRRILLLTPLAGLAVAGLAIAYAAATGRPSSDVLFSGQSALPALVVHAGGYAAGTLALLIACKGLAYSVSLSSFRGGPVFPAMFIGAAGGVLLGHLPGLTEVAGIAMGIGAMCAVMLRLPLTSVLLATLLLYSDGVAVMPLVIVAVVVGFVTASRLAPAPDPAEHQAEHRAA
jgi:H+/Cl- antiporter ClcA